MQKTLIVIAGPTAIGKTSLTIRLARNYNSEIISADSRQIFKEMKIGTAVPEPEELKAVPHHFIQNVSIHDDYNASTYEHQALAKLKELFKVHDLVFMTGGSGMYIEAVCSGIDKMPDIEPQIREKATALLKNNGIEALQEILKKADPEYYSETDINNPARLVRGVEMYWQTGKPFSFFRKKQTRPRDFNIIRISLDTDRDLLHQRINQRVDQMVAKGLIDEVKNLEQWQNLVPLKTVGYQEIFQYLNGAISLDEATELIKRNTRRYARKQLSWFRRNKVTTWFAPNEYESIKNHIDDAIRQEKTL